MAIVTLGTTLTTSLQTISGGWNRGVSMADIATVGANIKDDLNNIHPIDLGAFAQNGQLYIPNRGFLNMLPGDWIAYDTATGWPILLSARAIAAGPYTHA